MASVSSTGKITAKKKGTAPITHGGFFSIGGFDRDFGGTSFPGSNLPFGIYGNFFVGSGVAQLLIGGVCREGGCL